MPSCIWLDRSNKYEIVLEEPDILARHGKGLERLILAQHGQNFLSNSGGIYFSHISVKMHMHSLESCMVRKKERASRHKQESLSLLMPERCSNSSVEFLPSPSPIAVLSFSSMRSIPEIVSSLSPLFTCRARSNGDNHEQLTLSSSASNARHFIVVFVLSTLAIMDFPLSLELARNSDSSVPQPMVSYHQ
jgi:hypothetical protein